MKKNKIFLAGFWIVVVFLMSNVLRLGSNLILARLLAPDMFGLMAVVTVVTIGVAMFTDLGLWAFVVRHKNPTDTHLLNVVWTLQVVRGWVMFLVISVIALIIHFGNSHFPQYFQGVYVNPDLPLLIVITGTSSIISGYCSMASPLMHLEMRLTKLELSDFIAQFIGTTVMIIWILLNPTIWALLASSLVGAFFRTLLSYFIIPIRHNFVWDKLIALELFNFSKWIFISSALTYIFMQGDKLFFAAKTDASILGIYSIAFMLASTITTLTNMLATKVVFPVLAGAASGERAIFKQKYYSIRSFLDAPLFLFAGVLLSLSQSIVDFLYDARYSDAGWMLQVLTVMVVGNTLSTVSMECLSAISVVKIRMWVMAVRVLVLFISLPIFFDLFGFFGAVWAVAVNVWFSLPLIYLSLRKNSTFSFLSEVKMLPLVAIGFGLGKFVAIFLS